MGHDGRLRERQTPLRAAERPSPSTSRGARERRGCWPLVLDVLASSCSFVPCAPRQVFDRSSSGRRAVATEFASDVSHHTYTAGRVSALTGSMAMADVRPHCKWVGPSAHPLACVADQSSCSFLVQVEGMSSDRWVGGGKKRHLGGAGGWEIWAGAGAGELVSASLRPRRVGRASAAGGAESVCCAVGPLLAVDGLTLRCAPPAKRSLKLLLVPAHEPVREFTCPLPDVDVPPVQQEHCRRTCQQHAESESFGRSHGEPL